MSIRPIEFGPLLEGRFVRRPNRFLVQCEVDGLGTIEAFLPNPGRLWELLLPGAVLQEFGMQPPP
jgi:sugar fermentation stimulation protein A